MSVIQKVCRAMERIAPLRLAEKWDNVGLLLESPVQRAGANRILLTIDLTTAVCQEALASPTAVIVSYHPTIFSPLRSLTMANPLQASLLRCAAAGISIYSPHTALDSVYGGINDWLAQSIFAPWSPLEVKLIGKDTDEAGGEGRVCTLARPVNTIGVIAAVKKELGLDVVQVAYPSGGETKQVQSVGICAGSGGSVLQGTDADVFLTGEMSHHEVLAAVAAGKVVILCGHTNTERGYLPVLAEKLKAALASEEDDQSTIHVSKEDRHPLLTV